MTDQNVIELRWIFAVIRRGWWQILAVALLAAVIAFIVTSLLPPVYQSSAMLLINPSKNSATNQYNELMAGTQLALTYSKLVKDRPVLEAVISELGLKKSPTALDKQITAEPVQSSQIIKLTVTDSDPEQAALIANTLAKVFTKRVEELSAQRYASTIKSAKTRVEDLQVTITNLQKESDSVISLKVTKDVALADKQTSLTTLQSDYRSLQSSYQSLQLMVAEATGKVYIVEPVQVQPGVYQNKSAATAVVSVGQGQVTGGTGVADDRLALTYGKLLVKQNLLEGVISKLGLVETPEELAKKISYEIVTGTQLIRFTVEDTEGVRAQLIAQSLVDAFIAQVKALLTEPYSDRLESMQKQISDMETLINSAQTDIGKLTSEIAQMNADLNRFNTDLETARNDYREAQKSYENVQTTAVETSDAVTVTEPAEPSKAPSQSRTVYIALALILGLAIGTGLVFLLNYLDGKIQTDHDVRSMLNVSVLSTIGQLTNKDNDLVMNTAPASSIAEDFRVLGHKISLLSENASVKTLLITSPVPTEGKSTIVSNLAIGLTGIGMRVVIVDADLRLPRQHSLFGLGQECGLTNSLSTGNLNGALQSAGIGDLKVITSGQLPSNPAEVLSSPYLPKVLQELKEWADLVIIDCPPVLAASDASILASKVDGVLLVVRAGHTKTGAAREAVESLGQAKANLIGVVLNSAPNRRISYYHRPTNGRNGIAKLLL